LPINVCAACRESHYEKGKDVRCDIDFTCVKTRNFIDDPDEFMDLDTKERDVVHLWEKIVSISRLERIERQKNKKDVEVVYLKTLDKIDFVINNTNWIEMSITKQEAIHYIQVFHVVYISSI